MNFLFTDGGCWPNPGNGAWAYILKRECGSILKKTGYRSHTTNNQMELTAVIEGLKNLLPGDKVILYSDSQYVVNGINSWRHNWRKRNWDGVKNSDLWSRLDSMLTHVHLTARWVRGHDGHPENEECDKMAMQTYRSKR